MLKKILISFAFAVIAIPLQAQTPIPPALYVKSAEINAALAKSATERTGMAVGTITTKDNYRINLIHRTEPAGAIVHEVGTELHYITEGTGVLVTGGIVIRPADGGRATIKDGLARRVTVGDAILIPVGTPHWYSAIDGSITYLEVRF